MASQTLMTGDPQSIPQNLFSDSATPQAQVGQRVVSPDGRVFRYVKNGTTTAVVVGKVYSASAEITANENLSIAAAAIGDTQIVTTSTVTVFANQYAGGYAMITTSTGLGYSYLISSHAGASSAVVTFNLVDPIQVALTTSSKLDVVASPFSGIVVAPTTVSGAPVGVGVYPITAGYYGWIQSGGVANVLADGTVTVGSEVAVSVATAGAAGVTVAATQTPIGIALTGIATTEYGAVKLLLDQ